VHKGKGSLLHFFLFFLVSTVLAVGPPAIAERTAVKAFSPGVAHSASDSFWGGEALGMV
jgi:hypothetical protein